MSAAASAPARLPRLLHGGGGLQQASTGGAPQHLLLPQLVPLLAHLLHQGVGGELEGFRAVGEGAGEGGGLPAPLGVPLAGGGDLPGGGFILVPHQVLGVTA